MDIHTNQLRYFMELAKCLNFTRAAMNLYIAQPALSQQIADLEKHLGVTLFVRTSRSVTLTPAGEILKDACPDILAKMASVRKQLLSAQAGLRGSLRIAYLDAFQAFLPDIIRKYCGLYPDVAVDLSSGNPREVQTALRNGDADLIFTVMAPDGNASAGRTLWQEDLCLVIRKDHPFITSGGQDYTLLDNETFTLLDEDTVPGFHSLLQQVCGEIGLRITKSVTCKTSGPIMIQIATGMCASILPSGLCRHLCDSQKNLAWIPIKTGCLAYCAAWNTNSRNAALPLFLDVLEQTAKHDS